MSTAKPKRWPHAQSQNLREQKSPPAPPPDGAKKTGGAIIAAAPIKTAPAAVGSEPQKNAASTGVFDTSKTSFPGVVLPIEKAEAVMAGRDRAQASRVVKGLLGPVVWDGTLIVWSMPRTNTRLVIGYKKGTDPENPLNLFNVQVRENHNFMEGMSIPGPGGKLTEVNHNTYSLQGLCPRRKGRW